MALYQCTANINPLTPYTVSTCLASTKIPTTIHWPAHATQSVSAHAPDQYHTTVHISAFKSKGLPQSTVAINGRYYFLKSWIGSAWQGIESAVQRAQSILDKVFGSPDYQPTQSLSSPSAIPTSTQYNTLTLSRYYTPKAAATTTAPPQRPKVEPFRPGNDHQYRYNIDAITNPHARIPRAAYPKGAATYKRVNQMLIKVVFKSFKDEDLDARDYKRYLANVSIRDSIRAMTPLSYDSKTARYYVELSVPETELGFVCRPFVVDSVQFLTSSTYERLKSEH